MSEATPHLCDCHLIEVLAERADFPIWYCERTKTFDLLYDDGCGHMRLFYCFHCGGKLPEENYSLGRVPEEQERIEAEEVMSRSNSIADVIAAIGQPDEKIPWTDHLWHDCFEVLAERYPNQYAAGKKWSMCYRFSTRWAPLLLDVYEFPDGSLEHTIWAPSENG